MKIAIATSNDGKNIATIKEYYPIRDKGEVSHFLMELEIIKQDLIEIWEEFNYYKKDFEVDEDGNLIETFEDEEDDDDYEENEEDDE